MFLLVDYKDEELKRAGNIRKVIKSIRLHRPDDRIIIITNFVDRYLDRFNIERHFVDKNYLEQYPLIWGENSLLFREKRYQAAAFARWRLIKEAVQKLDIDSFFYMENDALLFNDIELLEEDKIIPFDQYGIVYFPNKEFTEEFCDNQYQNYLTKNWSKNVGVGDIISTSPEVFNMDNISFKGVQADKSLTDFTLGTLIKYNDKYIGVHFDSPIGKSYIDL